MKEQLDISEYSSINDLSHSELVSTIVAFDQVQALFQNLNLTDRSAAHEAILQLGLNLLDMETGVLGEVYQDQYIVRCIVSNYIDLPKDFSKPVKETHAASVIETSQSIVCPNIKDSLRPCDEMAFNELGIRSYVAAPIWIGEHLFGTLYFSSQQAQEEISLTKITIANMISQALGGFLYRESVHYLHQEQLKQLEKAKMAAEELAEAKSMFLAVMSHELRTPLTGILGMISLLQENPPPKEAINYLSLAHQSANDLMNIVNNTLDFSKIESGNIDLEQDAVDIKASSKLTFSSFENQAAKKDVELSVSYADNLPECFLCDSLRLKQILINLTTNAIKFTAKGSIHIFIDHKDEHIIYAITDTGIGMDKKQQEMLFTAYLQASSGITRKYGGTGLGLCISEKLARLMGGSINVESAPNEGSCFTLQLPYVATEKAESCVPEETKIKPTLVTKPTLALIIEDNVVNQLVAQRYLKSLGVDAMVANHSFEAFLKIRKHKFDIIMTDIHLPGMDGITIANKIYNKLGEACPPMIAMTADLTTKDQERYQQSKLRDILTKPLEIDSLAETLHTHLDFS